MKKNRLYVSALAAFVLLAAGCSDDLDDSGKGTTGGELNGAKTFMKVSVNPGVVTRATGGEEGDSGQNQGEVGTPDEYAVKDVTVILFRNAGDDYDQAPTEFKHDSKLVAAGFGTIPSDMNTSEENWHKRVATVSMTVTQDNEDFDGKTYGIIAVTNLSDTDGKALVEKVIGSSASVTTGAALANLLQTTYKGNSGFIMSTHNDKYDQSIKIFDKVTLQANADENNAPEAQVHVERLAAKVRVTEAEANKATDFIYTIGEGENTTAKVRLDEVAIVNQLSSGSFLLKRVTADVLGDSKDIPEMTDNHDNYLGNETATNEGAGTNYVIDPWTRNKKVTDGMNWNPLNITSETLASAVNLGYKNQFVGNNFAAMWEGFEADSKIALANNDKFTDTNTKLDLGYTMENTTSAAMSKNGFSTGALFKATYIPKQLSMVVEENGSKSVKPQDVKNYGKDADNLSFDNIAKDSEIELDFYVYQGNAYAGYDAIFNEHAWREQSSLNGQSGAAIYDYDQLSSTSITSINKKTFFESILGKTSDPLGYIAHLRSAVDTDNNGELSESEINGIDANATFAEADGIDKYVAADDNKATIYQNVHFFENCVCYYPYWIRHANNDNKTDMGVMEFAIVRNNIYDLTVTGINGYGYSGVEAPEPGKDDETNEFLFDVEIFVKNWVVRSNGDIIL